MPKDKELKELERLISKRVPKEYIYYGWGAKKLFKMQFLRATKNLERKEQCQQQ